MEVKIPKLFPSKNVKDFWDKYNLGKGHIANLDKIHIMMSQFNTRSPVVKDMLKGLRLGPRASIEISMSIEEVLCNYCRDCKRDYYEPSSTLKEFVDTYSLPPQFISVLHTTYGEEDVTVKMILDYNDLLLSRMYPMFNIKHISLIKKINQYRKDIKRFL